MRVISAVVGVLSLIVQTQSEPFDALTPWKTPRAGMGFVSDGTRLVIHGGGLSTQAGYSSITGFFQLDLSTNWTTENPPWKRLPESKDITISGIGADFLPNGRLLILGVDSPVVINKTMILVTVDKTGQWTRYQDLPNELTMTKYDCANHYVVVSPKGEIFIPSLEVMFPSIEDLKPISVPKIPSSYNFGWSESLGTVLSIMPNAASELFKLVKGNVSSGFEWEKEMINGDVPSAAQWACTAKEPGSDRYYYYGGIDHLKNLSGRLYLLDLPARKWTLLASDGYPRMKLACAATKNAFVAWGGQEGDKMPLKDAKPLVFDIKKGNWTNEFVAEFIPPPPPPPPPRPPKRNQTRSSTLPPQKSSTSSPIQMPTPDADDGEGDGSLDDAGNGDSELNTPADQKQHDLKMIAIAGGAGGGAILFTLIALIFCLRHGHKKQRTEDWNNSPRRLTRSGRRDSYSSDDEEDFRMRRSQYRPVTRSRDEEFVNGSRSKESSSFLDRGPDRHLVQTWHRQ